jgi:stage V sporulation protein SpoVS
MTFSTPVAAKNRSRSVAGALAPRLKSEETMLARACEAANASEEIRALEQEFDAISTGIAEPWTDSLAR